MQLITNVVNSENGLGVSSRDIAKGLNKSHKHVLDSIDTLIQEASRKFVQPQKGILKSEYTPQPLIIPSFYVHLQNKQEYRESLLTKDGFILYMFNVQGYNEFKMAYINKFNQMEKSLDISLLSLQEELRAKDKVIELLSKGLPYNSNVRVV